MIIPWQRLKWYCARSQPVACLLYPLQKLRLIHIIRTPLTARAIPSSPASATTNNVVDRGKQNYINEAKWYLANVKCIWLAESSKIRMMRWYYLVLKVLLRRYCFLLFSFTRKTQVEGSEILSSVDVFLASMCLPVGWLFSRFSVRPTSCVGGCLEILFQHVCRHHHIIWAMEAQRSFYAMIFFLWLLFFILMRCWMLRFYTNDVGSIYFNFLVFLVANRIWFTRTN